MVRVAYMRDGVSLRFIDLFGSGPVTEEWEPVELVTYRGEEPSNPALRELFDLNFLVIGGLTPMFSEELADLLRPHLVNDAHGEYLPGFLGDRRYLFYNSWRVDEAFDDAASEYHVNSAIPDYKGFTKPVLVASKLSDDPPFFRLTKRGHSYVVNETVHDIMESVGHLGDQLVEVEVLDC